MICTGLLIWQSAHNSSNAANCYRQPQPSFASATIAALALSVWPNPSAACVDDFAVHGSVVKGLRRLETVMPRPLCPGNRHQKHQTQPPQTTGFDQVAITGTNWVTIDTLGCNSLALRRSIVSSAPLLAPLGQTYYKLLQQQSAGLIDQRPIEHPMIPLKLLLMLHPHYPQNRTYGPFPRSKNCSHQQYDR